MPVAIFEEKVGNKNGIVLVFRRGKKRKVRSGGNVVNVRYEH